MAWSTRYLADRGSKTPRLDAEVLLASALQLKRVELYMYFERPLSADEKLTLREFLKRRGRLEPVAYITGEKEFMGYRFCVTPDVLIPRPETELIVEKVLDIYGSEASIKIMDLGTGSGLHRTIAGTFGEGGIGFSLGKIVFCDGGRAAKCRASRS